MFLGARLLKSLRDGRTRAGGGEPGDGDGADQDVATVDLVRCAECGNYVDAGRVSCDRAGCPYRA